MERIHEAAAASERVEAVQILVNTPKKFANIVRFQHTIRMKKSGFDYLDIAQAGNFSDHAHLAHDFKAFAGTSPEQFFQKELQPELAKTFNEYESRSAASHVMYH